MSVEKSLVAQESLNFEKLKWRSSLSQGEKSIALEEKKLQINSELENRKFERIMKLDERKIEVDREIEERKICAAKEAREMEQKFESERYEREAKREDLSRKQVLMVECVKQGKSVGEIEALVKLLFP